MAIPLPISGFFLILACQRPDAKHLGDGMMFGSDVQKHFFLKQIKGREYDNVISEFYTPLVSKENDFLNEIAKLAR